MFDFLPVEKSGGAVCGMESSPETQEPTLFLPQIQLQSVGENRQELLDRIDSYLNLAFGTFGATCFHIFSIMCQCAHKFFSDE